MIIGFTGRMQSGKTTAANVLVEEFGFQKMSFADPIREMMADIDPIVHPDGLLSYSEALHYCDGYDGAKKLYPEIRRLMQSIGVSARERIGEDVWVNALVNRLPTYKAKQVSIPLLDSKANVVIDDVRFLNETEMIREIGGRVYRIERPCLPQSDHVSETEGDAIRVDSVFPNYFSTADAFSEFVAQFFREAL